MMSYIANKENEKRHKQPENVLQLPIDDEEQELEEEKEEKKGATITIQMG